MTAYVYGLKDPSTQEIRYIGKTVNPRARVKQHMAYARRKKTHRDMWLLTLREPPELVILEEVTDGWQLAEQRWIAYGKSQGWPLTNLTDGGDGISSKTLKGRQYSEKHRHKISEGLRGHKVSDATKKKMSESHKGKKRPPHSKEWNQRISEALKGNQNAKRT